MDLEVGNIYTNGNEYRKILNINNNMIEYEKLQVIKCEDVDSFSNWATDNKQGSPIIDKILTQHFYTSSYSNNLDEEINEWIDDVSLDSNIIDIDIKYEATHIDSSNYTKYSALVILKLKYI